MGAAAAGLRRRRFISLQCFNSAEKVFKTARLLIERSINMSTVRLRDALRVRGTRSIDNKSHLERDREKKNNKS